MFNFKDKITIAILAKIIYEQIYKILTRGMKTHLECT